MARTMAGRRVLVVTHGGTLWCFRYVLERWTYKEAEERFRTEAIQNCSVTSYRYDEAARRLVLGETGRTFWK
jgi:broad specificity phosphatase PhoE